MMSKKVLIGWCFLMMCAAAAGAGDIVLVANGRSEYVIYTEAGAPPFVKDAAAELQRVILLSTGVQLPIAEKPGAKMICLGDNAASRQAGLLVEGVPEEGFRIETKGASVYIVGNDRYGAELVRMLPWNPCGISRGTLFGTYDFLERVVGVRWLMPGEEGEDIPTHEVLTVPQLSITDAPDFEYRQVGYIRERFHPREAEALQWKSRLRLGGSFVPSHAHAWIDLVPREVLRAHPEYLAWRGKSRQRIPDDDKVSFWPNFCTTNQGLVKEVAKTVSAWFDKNPKRTVRSISPTDGSAWCLCENCVKYHETPPSPTWGEMGNHKRSVTPLMLKFYNDVARFVAVKYPNKFVCGLVYYDYTFPPEKPVEMEPNVMLVMAPLHHYGLTRYKPEYEKEFEKLCAAWGAITPNMGYTDYAVWLRTHMGTPIAPAFRILKHTFPTLKRHGWHKISSQCGLGAWGYGAVTNYLTAKLMWNADTDVDALYKDWLRRAYGPASKLMDRLYRLLDNAMAEYKRKAPKARSDYDINAELALKVYLPNFWKIEKLYLGALDKVETEAQRRRLDMFGDNLAVMHHVFHSAGMLENSVRSIFYKDPETYETFLKEKRGVLSMLHPVYHDRNERKVHRSVAALCIPERRELTIPLRAKDVSAPIIDGRLNDPAWKHAALAEGFCRAGSKTPAQQPTSVRALFDDENLYLSFRCVDTKTVSKTTLRDDNVIYSDDCVEFFFVDNLPHPKRYWHLTLNPGNVQWDALTIDGSFETKYDLEWKSAVSVEKNLWTAEICLPFKSLTPDEYTKAPRGQSWRVNLTREDKPAKENSCWTNVENHFSDPDEFGTWKFAQE